MTRRFIRFKLWNDQRWLERAILAIDNRQTSDEKSNRQTIYLNKRGWNAADAKIGSYLASYIRNSPKPLGEKLSGKWVGIAKRVVTKYSGQLQLVAAERVAA